MGPSGLKKKKLLKNIYSWNIIKGAGKTTLLSIITKRLSESNKIMNIDGKVKKKFIIYFYINRKLTKN